MKVRAAVARKAGEKLSLETVDLDGPREGEVLVEIKATGICHTDEYTLSGADPEGLFPAILGHEGAGVVVDIGKNVGACAPLPQDGGCTFFFPDMITATKFGGDGGTVTVCGDQTLSCRGDGTCGTRCSTEAGSCSSGASF